MSCRYLLAQDLVLLSADDLEKNGVRDKRDAAAIADVLSMKVASQHLCFLINSIV